MIRFLYVLLAFLSVSTAFAQDRYAKSILDEVSKKYDSYRTIQSNFTFKAVQAKGENYSDKGEMFMNKPAQQYKIVLPEQDLISDGKSVWSVLKEDKEVQVSEADNSNESIGPNNIFTFYRTGFKYISMDDESVSGAGKLKVIELSPEDTKRNYFKIKLRINKNNHIHDVTIFDKSGSRYTYTINTLYVNNPIPASTFQFQKANYAGFEVVDLR
ncbi:LolA family protein [Sphingobacterium sp. UBA6645]|uniref:LolA family protein n=1 Tax=Sphingobacterium sp. UBA6645 TaxID=1947511 RepID=UPI0025E377C7|nr:outer membrane lipoprotein carrier protein LolA [Sphingobacterium sp. UBA6645]